MHSPAVPPRRVVRAADRSHTLKVRRWGRRHAVLLPEEVAAELGLEEGTLLDVTVRRLRGGDDA